MCLRRLEFSLQLIWVKIAPFLDLERKPMKAIGRVAGVIAWLGYLAVVACVRLWQRL